MKVVYTKDMFDAALFSKHLEEDETVSVIVHKHWLFAVRALTFPTISFFLSLSMLSVTKVQLGLYIASVWSVASMVWWVRNFLDYYLDAWIVTNQGIIDLEWHGWFHRQSARILYSDVQGVSYEIKGLFGTFLRFGDLTVEKISTGAAVSLLHVPRPRSVEARILQNMEQYLHKKNMKDSRHVQEILAGIIAGQVQMQPAGGQTSGPVPVLTDIKPETPASAKRSGGFRSSKLGSRTNT